MKLYEFLVESLAIEGIHRPPTDDEITASELFLSLNKISLNDICTIQAVFTPNMLLRDQHGMDIKVGQHIAPAGGMAVAGALGNLAYRISQGADPYKSHIEFETLHPFMDGNGRVGRLVWAWNMKRIMQDPFAIRFLHRWYFQSLAAIRE